MSPTINASNMQPSLLGAPDPSRTASIVIIAIKWLCEIWAFDFPGHNLLILVILFKGATN